MTTRGLRLNNPGNIRKGIEWQGMADVQNDSDFITFISPEYGIRAMAKVFQSYATEHQIKTLAATVKRYAPQVENDTQAYLKCVCKDTGYNPDEEIDLTDPITLEDLIPAFIQHENGSQPYSKSQIAAGVALAV